jgi:hypothetical protein
LCASSSTASRLLACWLRSVCTFTLMPVARWMARTADSVLFTCCPPGPDERVVSKRISLGSVSDGASQRATPKNQFLRAWRGR